MANDNPEIDDEFVNYENFSDEELRAMADKIDVIKEKMILAQTIPGYEVEFDPDEAEELGAFVEDAISEEDALEGSIDIDNYGHNIFINEGIILPPPLFPNYGNAMEHLDAGDDETLKIKRDERERQQKES